MKPRGTGEGFLGENLNLAVKTSDLNDKRNDFNKEKTKRGFGVFRTKSKNKGTFGTGASYEQCFSGSNFTSQYEDECPVNYSLKYSETESCKGTKKKFKDYSDYAETDLDQPTNFSLKYAEKTYDDENKTAAFTDYNNHKVRFKEYADYVETDLDQPTDFTLKYRESAEEDVKNLEFGYFENEDQKTSTGFGSQTASEDAPPERLPERYTSQNETPLMFSRSSSMNSLSSFVHITQSIPDDRSSVVSDFSRMTSGIISPSELPDSPTQTAPSSPKRQKHPKNNFSQKRSVFEDDVATYKQEDTPIEFSRATSLSSLNIENPVKSELVIKRNTNPLVASKKENQTPVEVQPEHIKQQIAEKLEHEKEKFELASVLEVDESLFADCISIDIQINCRKPKSNYNRLIMSQENSPHLRQSNGFPVKPGFRLRFHNENRKGYSTYEGSDDAVHTYHTEGTPANVSHAGSHSDLSALSISSGIPLSGVDDNSDEYLSSEDTETVPKAETLKSNVKAFTGSESVGMNMSKTTNLDVYAKNQTQLGFLRKDHQLTAKDETATFATENSPCDISIRSSLSDLTVNVMDAPLAMNRTEEPPSQMLSPLRNVSPQSPNSIGFEEAEDTEKCLEEGQTEFISPEPADRKDAWDLANETEKADEKPETNTSCSRTEGVEPPNLDFHQPLTPFEEALVEECIRLGMHQKKMSEQPQETRFGLTEGKTGKEPEQDTFAFSKRNFNGKNEKKTAGNAQVSGSNTPNADNFDFDSREPLTPFEEVLLEQCIRLGMPQRKNSETIEEPLNLLDGGTENFDCEPAEVITPLDTALLEQCIRLGMSQKKNPKKGEGGLIPEEPHKQISCLTAHLNKLRLNPENEKDKKSENCQCGKRHRKKNASCKKAKSRSVHFKVESCPV